MHRDITEMNGRLSKRVLPGLYDLKKIWNPSWFQGNRHKPHYFEGWYYKLVTADKQHSLAFIPGISTDPSDTHSFIQVINGKTGQTWYYRFPIADFHFSTKKFAVRIGRNYFSEDHIDIDISNENGSFSGKLSFRDQTSYPASLARPGIMGWYRYVPFMECYHGVVSLDHEIHGSVATNDNAIAFDGGRGYIEKDWGRSMPDSWIWMQTNHFDTPHTSFMLSVARIPWIKKSFTGFLGFFLYQNHRYDFGTYSGAKVRIIENTNNDIQIQILAKSFALHITGKKGMDGQLKAPQSGNMKRVIHESINASIEICLTDKNGKVIYKGSGTNAGLELVGDIGILKP